MRSDSQYTAEVLRRLNDFLQRQPVNILIGDLKGPMARLDATIKELEAVGSEAESRDRAAKAATKRIQGITRQAQMEFMRPIARAARMLFEDNPAALDTLQIGKRLKRPSAVIDALRGLADAAAPYKADLVKEGGLAEDFPDRMRTLANTLKEAIDGRALERGRRSGASAGAIRTARAGRKIISYLDSVVAERLVSNPKVLQEWQSLLKQGRIRPTPVDDGTDTPETPGTPTTPATPSTPTTPTTTSTPNTSTPQQPAAPANVSAPKAA